MGTNAGREPEAGRLIALDGLRGLAALAVVLFHFLDRGPGLYPEIGERVVAAGLGSYGVNLFFIISGFVIIMTMQRSAPRRFVISRFIRLYPVYWVCMAITFGVVAIFGLPGREVSIVDAVANLTMLQEYVGLPHVDGAYWTLTAELAFYAVCFVLLLTGSTSPRRMDVIIPVWIALSAVALLWNSQSDNVISSLADKAFGWSPLFIVGILVHDVWSGDRRWWRIALIPVAVAVMGLHDPRELIASVVVVALMIIVVWGPSFGLASSGLRWLGTISFSLYLLHQNIGYVVLRGLAPQAGQGVATVVALAIVLGLATLVTYLFDIPVRRALRRRFLDSNRHSGYEDVPRMT